MKTKHRFEQHSSDIEVDDDTTDPLGIAPEGPEEWLNQFFQVVEAKKVHYQGQLRPI